MEFFEGIPVWLLAILIFSFRALDVTMGTVRTLAVVEGRLPHSVILGFFEITIWVFAISQVISRLHESPFLILAYAGGFAAGNALGISIERKVAFGNVVLRIITNSDGEEIAQALRDNGQMVTTFLGEGRDGPVMLLFALTPRRNAPKLVSIAMSVNPTLFYSLDRVNEWHPSNPGGHVATGWRSRTKKK